MHRSLPTLLLLASLAGCAAPRSAPPPAPAPASPPPSAPAPPALSTDWRDWPASPGDWVYRQDARGSIALFGVPGADAAFTIRCDKARRSIYLSRAGSVGTGPARMTVRTSFGDIAWPVQDTGGTPPYAAATISPADPWLDHMAYSRGRFAVLVGALPHLSIPAWPEFTRVVEDCRADTNLH